jgi:hypothetical protein
MWEPMSLAKTKIATALPEGESSGRRRTTERTMGAVVAAGSRNATTRWHHSEPALLGRVGDFGPETSLVFSGRRDRAGKTLKKIAK